MSEDKKYCMKCPDCGDTRNKKNTRSLHVVIDEKGNQYARCYNPGCSFNAERKTKFNQEEIKQYEKTKIHFKDIPDGLQPQTNDGATLYPYYRTADTIAFYIYREGHGKTKKIYSIALDENDNWVWTRPMTKLLYRQEKLDQSKQRAVLVVEGEKAAEAAAVKFPKADVVTWVGGASSTKNGNWSLLDGRTVYLFPDNDDEGRKAMTEIAAMIDGKVLMVDTSSLPPKADLADDVDLDSVRQLMKEAAVIKDGLPKFKGEFDPKQLKELHSKKLEYVSTGWTDFDKKVKLPPNGVVLVSGRTNHGKSIFMVNMASLLAQLGEYEIVYLSIEMPINMMNLLFVKAIDGAKYAESGWEDDIKYNDQIFNETTPAAKKYISLLNNRNIRLFDQNADIKDIQNIMIDARKRNKKVILFVDYFQLLPVEGGGASRYEKLKQMIEILRKTADTHNHLIVGGSQLTKGDTPMQDDIRESKDLEFTSALHLKVFNRGKAKTEAEQNYMSSVAGTLVVSVEKSRQGGANGTVLGFDFTDNGVKLLPVAQTQQSY